MPRILYVQYTNPGGYPPLEHSSRILADNGSSVIFLGTGALGANCLKFPSHPQIEVRQMQFCPAGWRQKLHYLAYCLWVLWVILTWRPKWVYASDSLICPVALIVSRIPGLKLIYHEHDTPAPGHHANGFLRFVSRARRVVAQRADICVLPNAKRLERFKDELGPIRRSFCVWNCPTIKEVVAEPKIGAAPIWLLYHGSIVPERLSLSVIDALVLLPKSVHLRVVGYETVGSQGYVRELEHRAASLGVASRIELHGAQPRADLLRLAALSGIGLALLTLKSQDENFLAMTGASNKAFDYLACGLPLLVSDLPDWRRMFVDPGYAFPCNPDDPHSIAAGIRAMIEDPDRMRAMGEAGRQRILAEWNYEDQFQPVLDMISGKPDPGVASLVNDGRVENAV